MKTKAIFVGVDPGLTGSLGIIDQDSRPIAVIDIITRIRNIKETVIKKEFDACPTNTKLTDRLINYPDHEWHGWIETPFSMPGGNMMGTNSLFQTYGGLLAMMELLGIKTNTIRPVIWKKGLGLNKKKDYSLELASNLWPTLGLNQKKYHNRAEAMLLAEYGRLKWHQERQFKQDK